MLVYKKLLTFKLTDMRMQEKQDVSSSDIAGLLAEKLQS